MAKAEQITLKFQPGEPFANSLYYKHGDYDLHYRIDPAVGTEKAKMFMIHGFGCDTTFFDELVERYTKAGIKCVRADLPDFGYSTRETKGINFVPQIPMLYELMDQLDTDKSGFCHDGSTFLFTFSHFSYRFIIHFLSFDYKC